MCLLGRMSWSGSHGRGASSPLWTGSESKERKVGGPNEPQPSVTMFFLLSHTS